MSCDESQAPRQGPNHLYLELIKKTLTASIFEESAWVSAQSSHNPWLKRLDRLLRRRSLLLLKTKRLDPALRREGRDWPLFGYTMAGHHRLDNVQECVETVLRDGIPGDLMETGAWRGGATIFMRALLKAHGVEDRTVWVADSFEGLPKPKDALDGWDYSQVDFMAVSLDTVKANFQRFDLLDEQVQFLKGWFCDTLPAAPVRQLAVLRLDGDMYSSTMDALQNLHHKVSPGGYVIVDDYYSWPACRRAVTEYLEQHSLRPDIRQIDWTGAYWRV